MTLFVPLDTSAPAPATPSFVATSADPVAELQKVIKSIVKAKRIVVVCGAGISVQAGIPDFRSPEGLFQSLKKESPKEASVSSGKDLFDASVFNSEQTMALFFQMISRLSELSVNAEPTPFHHILRNLDERQRLLRVYTQNIDALESKAGLSFGVPGAGTSKQTATAKFSDPSSSSSRQSSPPSESAESGPSTAPFSFSEQQKRQLTPPAETPRCIPLHGTIQTLHCQVCLHTFPLLPHLPSLAAGTPPPCPECAATEATRRAVGKRARGVGRLRPSVVLYNEAHRDGEGVGEIVQKDLMGVKRKPDLVLVVGTSLRVPGTKRMVREFAKAVKREKKDDEDEEKDAGQEERKGKGKEKEKDEPPRRIYLNLDFPVPTREWEGVFDVWVQGDAQKFAQLLHDAIEEQNKARERRIERRERMQQRKKEGLETPKKEKKENKEKSDGSQRKRKATSAAMSLASFSIHDHPGPYLSPSTPKRRKVAEVVLPPTPASTPRLKIRMPTEVPKVVLNRRVPFQNSSSHSSSTSPTREAPTKTVSPFATGRPPPTPDKSPPRSYGTSSDSEMEVEAFCLSRKTPSMLNYGPGHWDWPHRVEPRWKESFIRTRHD